jgi:hypothetical protein
MIYSKKQIGWIFLLIMTAICVLFFIVFETKFISLSLSTFLIVIILCVIASLLFYQLRVTVFDKTLTLIYGIGLIRIKKEIDKFQSIEVIKIPWYYGILIRITSEGMLFNIQGFKGVRITYMENGNKKSFMVGTPEPEKLKKVLEDKFKILINN